MHLLKIRAWSFFLAVLTEASIAFWLSKNEQIWGYSEPGMKRKCWLVLFCYLFLPEKTQGNVFLNSWMALTCRSCQEEIAMESWAQRTLELFSQNAAYFTGSWEESFYEDFTYINNTLNNGVVAAGLSQVCYQRAYYPMDTWILLYTVCWFSFNSSVPFFYQLSAVY